jgi:dipeptidyl aminopeptidase/acylaminoacyl peptidase
MSKTTMLVATAALVATMSPATADAAPTPSRGALVEPRIAYVRDGDLWTVLPDGSDDVQVTSGSATDADPAWSPDGSLIAFTRRSADGPAIWTVPAEGGTPVRLLRKASDPSWAPDGLTIAFVRRADRNTDVWAADADGANARRLTTSPAVDVEPSWGPSKIAFVSGRGGRRSIWLMSGNGRRERRLTGGKGSDRSPTWVLGAGPGLDVLHEHIDTGGDHDLRTVRVSDGTYTDILVRSDRDETPSSAALAWFAFMRRTTSSSTIRTSDVDAPLTTMRIIVSAPGLSDPAVAPVVA